MEAWTKESVPKHPDLRWEYGGTLVMISLQHARQGLSQATKADTSTAV